MRQFLLVAMVCGAVSGAQAADMPDLPFLRGSFTDGLTSAKVNWQGYYVGGQASYGSTTSKVAPGANTDLQSSFVPPTGVSYNWQPLPNAHSNTTGFGAFAGYNSQWEDVVLSLEANYIHDGIRSVSDSIGVIITPDLSIHSLTHSNAVVKLSDFGSLRIRAGYIMGCFLPYAFAGTGFGSQTVDRTISAFPYPVLGTSRRQQDQAGLWIQRRRRRRRDAGGRPVHARRIRISPGDVGYRNQHQHGAGRPRLQILISPAAAPIRRR